jgi:hypothetical protein
MEAYHTCTHEDGTVKPAKHCLKAGEEEGGNGKITEGGVNVSKVNCTHAWNCHHEKKTNLCMVILIVGFPLSLPCFYFSILTCITLLKK